MLRKIEKPSVLQDIEKIASQIHPVQAKKEAVLRAFETLEKITSEIIFKKEAALCDQKEEVAPLRKKEIELLQEENNRFLEADINVKDCLESLISALKNSELKESEIAKKLEAFFNEWDDFVELAISYLHGFHFFTLTVLQPNRIDINSYLHTRSIIINKIIHQRSGAVDFVKAVQTLFRIEFTGKPHPFPDFQEKMQDLKLIEKQLPGNAQGVVLALNEGYRNKKEYFNLICKQPSGCASDMYYALSKLSFINFIKNKENELFEWLSQHSGHAKSIIDGYIHLMIHKVFEDEVECRKFLDKLFCTFEVNHAKEILSLLDYFVLSDLLLKGKKQTLFMLIKHHDNLRRIVYKLDDNTKISLRNPNLKELEDMIQFIETSSQVNKPTSKENSALDSILELLQKKTYKQPPRIYHSIFISNKKQKNHKNIIKGAPHPRSLVKL